MRSQRIAQRRRRVALEQTQTDAPAPDANALSAIERHERSRKTNRPYEHGARRSRQFKTTDLIPKRSWSVAAIIALAFAAVSALNLLHLNSPDWITYIGQEGVEALSLDSRTGLAVWYSNFLLLLTACVSLQLYLLRQHRRDDYKGSYRIWMWLAFVFLIASAASVTGISSLLANATEHLFSKRSFANGITFMLIAKLVGLLLLFGRSLIEVRHSRLAISGLVLVLAAYTGASLINEIPAIQSKAGEVVHSACGNCMLFGSTALFLTVLTFARFVYLEANGLVRRKVKATSAEIESESLVESPSADESKPARKSKQARKSKTVDEDAESESAEAEEEMFVEAEEQSPKVRWMDALRERRQQRRELREATREERSAEKTDRKAERAMEKEAARDEKLAARQKRAAEKVAAQEAKEAERIARAEEAAVKAEEAAAQNATQQAQDAAPHAQSKQQPAAQRTQKVKQKQQPQTIQQNQQQRGKRTVVERQAAQPNAMQQKVLQQKKLRQQQQLQQEQQLADARAAAKASTSQAKRSNAKVSDTDEHLLSLSEEQVSSLSKSDLRRLRKLRRRAA